MAELKLIEICRVGGDNDDKVIFQYDKNTNELYVNNNKVITAVEFSKSEKFLAWLAAISVFMQALMSVVTYVTEYMFL